MLTPLNLICCAPRPQDPAAQRFCGLSQVTPWVRFCPPCFGFSVSLAGSLPSGTAVHWASPRFAGCPRGHPLFLLNQPFPLLARRTDQLRAPEIHGKRQHLHLQSSASSCGPTPRAAPAINLSAPHAGMSGSGSSSGGSWDFLRINQPFSETRKMYVHVCPWSLRGLDAQPPSLVPEDAVRPLTLASDSQAQTGPHAVIPLAVSKTS